MTTSTWRVTLEFGCVVFSTIETAISEDGAIESARRYAAACGYSGHPDHTYSKRI